MAQDLGLALTPARLDHVLLHREQVVLVYVPQIAETDA
jgi:hypothetical protein